MSSQTQTHCNYSYHITVRCNNREFRLTHLECRQIFLYVIKKAIEKYSFKLYSVCIMSTGLTQNRTKVGVIHELPLRNNQGCSYILRKS
jgi:hypothetical protein